MKPTVAQKYVAALYWSVATLSTLGYGDVIPVNDTERIIASFLTVVGASAYAYMVGRWVLVGLETLQLCVTASLNWVCNTSACSAHGEWLDGVVPLKLAVVCRGQLL